MLTRLVKLTIAPKHTDTFIQLFENRKEKIAAFAGCVGVSLLRDAEDARVFFTHSIWQTHTDLELYRNSAFFKETWARVKPLFAAKPEAWSVEKVA
jgi:(4S)-4-hydroxy-5-phosphonooxypentane-2,3-dione isomerase